MSVIFSAGCRVCRTSLCPVHSPKQLGFPHGGIGHYSQHFYCTTAEEKFMIKWGKNGSGKKIHWAFELKKKCFSALTKCTLVLLLSILKQNKNKFYSFDRKKIDFFLMTHTQKTKNLFFSLYCEHVYLFVCMCV